MSESPNSCHDLSAAEGDEGLQHKDERNDGQIGQLVGVQLRGELCEDQARREDHGVEFGDEFLTVGVEHAGVCYEETRQSDKDDFQDGFADQTSEIDEARVGGVRRRNMLLESIHCGVGGGDEHRHLVDASCAKDACGARDELLAQAEGYGVLKPRHGGGGMGCWDV